MDTEQALVAKLDHTKRKLAETQAKLDQLRAEALIVVETWPVPPVEMMVRLIDAIVAAEQKPSNPD